MARVSALTRARALIGLVAIAAVLAGSVAWRQLPMLGAGGLLHPGRRHVGGPRPENCQDASIDSAGVVLRGWRCGVTGVRRGTLVYLHGIADNRTSAVGVVLRFAPRGFEVVAFDSRAHGESGGDACTYGFFEKDNLHRIIDSLQPGPIVLLGTSLGAAVALQEAAHDPRVTAIVAVETFSDLKSVATERAPWFFPPSIIGQAFQLAERQGHFSVDAVSPVDAAGDITVPVLLLHGTEDVDTRPEHSQRVFAAVKGPKQLILVPGARHNGSLTSDSWKAIEQWIDTVIPGLTSKLPAA
ncbi:MAG: alpha/beta fold hydrolase [Acidobacteriota bacterium]